VSEPAGFLRRSAAWTIDATAISALATLATWRWVAPAASAVVASVQALADAMAQRLVDGMLAGTLAPVLVQRLLHDPSVLAHAASVEAALWSLLAPWLLAYAAFALAWHVAGDLSRWRGSPGKHWLGLRVERADGGGAPTPAQALLRETGSVLSWLTLNLGHALALVPPRRQALHDLLSRTRVVHASMPTTAGGRAAAPRSPPSIWRQAE
jgi:uncharacterized RDD family membrane protein YckC